jgi:hypothetical protein
MRAAESGDPADLDARLVPYRMGYESGCIWCGHNRLGYESGCIWCRYMGVVAPGGQTG